MSLWLPRESLVSFLAAFRRSLLPELDRADDRYDRQQLDEMQHGDACARNTPLPCGDLPCHDRLEKALLAQGFALGVLRGLVGKYGLAARHTLYLRVDVRATLAVVLVADGTPSSGQTRLPSTARVSHPTRDIAQVGCSQWQYSAPYTLSLGLA